MSTEYDFDAPRWWGMGRPRGDETCGLCQKPFLQHSRRCSSAVFAVGENGRKEIRRCLRQRTSCNGRHVYRGIRIEPEGPVQ